MENLIKKQIVVFGGCFNPPLNSHFSLAEQLIEEYNQIEKIIFMPVNSQYQKVDLIENKHRYEMLKLVCNQNEKFELYTIETLTKLQKQYEKHEICFTMGSDNLKELETWSQAEKLIKNFKIYVFERDKDDTEEIIETNKFLKENRQAFIIVKNIIKSSLSSTLVREKIKEGKSIRYLTSDEIVSYIKQNNLYQ